MMRQNRKKRFPLSKVIAGVVLCALVLLLVGWHKKVQDEQGRQNRENIETRQTEIETLEQQTRELLQETQQLQQFIDEFDEEGVRRQITELKAKIAAADVDAGTVSEHPQPGEGCSSPRVAVALRTRHSTIADIEFLLDHHFSIGFCHAFIRIQHTPNLRYVLNEPKYHGKVSPIWVDDWPVFHDSDPPDVFEKQKKKFMDLWRLHQDFVNDAKEQALKYGMDWLVSIDDDELVYYYNRGDISHFFSGIPDHIADVHFKNYESVVDASEIDTHVHHRFGGTLFYKGARLGYDEGKSAVRVKSNLVDDGYFFKLPEGDQHVDADFRLNVDPDDVVILHYESSDFYSWVKKFAQYRTADVSLWKWPFYRESHGKVEELRAFFLSRKKATPDEAALRPGAYAIGVNVTDMVKLPSYQPEFYESRPSSYKEYGADFRVLW